MDAQNTLSKMVGAFNARERDEAAQHLEDLVRSEPPLGETWAAVSRLASTLGEFDHALAALRAYVAVKPEDQFRQMTYCATLAKIGRVEEALDAAEAIAAAHPGDARAIHLKGTLLAQMGQNEAALSELRRAITLQNSVEATAWTWLAISDLKTFRQADEDLSALLNLRKTPASVEALSAIDYAIGKAFNDIGDTRAAFAAYSSGARAMAQKVPFDLNAETKFVDHCLREFSAGFFERLASSSVHSQRPIFVLGPPRSGTTLIEQILVSHSAVSAGAEINLFTVAAMGLKSFTPEGVKRFDHDRSGSDPWSKIGKSYLHLLDQRFGLSGRIVDKTLNQGRIIGIIQHVLPEARFIWMSRNIGDVAWSCFRTRFASNIDWSWSLESIGAYLRQEDRLREYWSRELPDKVLEVPYEAIVKDPETWIPRVLQHAQLPFEPGVMSFHETQRPVQTASVAQVRRPLYKTSIEGWRRYEAELQPMFAAYNA